MTQQIPKRFFTALRKMIVPETLKTAFTAKLHLGVDKRCSYDHVCDMIARIIYDKYSWGLNKIYGSEELFNEYEEGPLYDFIRKHNIPFEPRDSSKQFTNEDLYTYIKSHNLDTYIINYINNVVFPNGNVITQFNTDATITYTITDFTNSGDIDRYIYMVMNKLNNILIRRDDSLILYNMFKLDMSEMIEKFKAVESLKDDPRLNETTMDIPCVVGYINVVKCEFESK